MVLAKKHICIIYIILALSSCGVEQPDPSMMAMETITYSEPTGIEVWIDSSRQEIKLFRIRKANGASRMRLLAEMSDSMHFSLFLTPFELGSQPIETGNVSDEIFKFSRTHCELKQQVDESNFYLYEVDSALAFDNRVEITEIDTIQRTVSGNFQCQMKMVVFEGDPTGQPLKIRGAFDTSYRD